MGKLPPSLRSANFAVNTLIKTPSPSPSPPPTSKPHYYPKKSQTPKKKLTSNTEPQLPSSIVAFDSTSLSDAKTLFNSLISNSRNPTSDNKFYNAVLQSFSSNSTLQDSIFFLNHVIKVHPPFSPDRFTYHVLLIQSCKSVDLSLSPVHQVLNLMTTNGFPPNKVSTDIAVRTLCSSGHEEQAIELVKELSSKDSPPDTYTYNFIVRHLCKNRPLSTMNNFIKEMREGFDIKPDLVTYTIMIDNVCNSKNLREATRLLGVLSEEGYKPDCYVYNTIMKGYCMLSQGGEVLGVYKKMQEEGVKPDLVTYNTLIYGLSKSGRVKDAKKFLNVMMEEGHVPDAVTYTSLMNGMCREADPLGAVALLEKMEARGCAPNSCTYNTLLHGLCKGRLLDKGMKLYDVMKQNSTKLETGSYGTFLRALCRNGRVAEAYDVFDYAIESKSLTDVAAYTTLESTLKWLKKAREQGLVI
ncbi:pentatricopeptide repeat-containing protein At2g17670 [Solanum tuberosum]|uniref:Pentatricopeptide repeat-containing protein n=2 Tax=Solanum TaxID=4107 RepID=M1DKX2_SOLTU|nr:PREDICTED: pentatricopeptide repeat-containing protein At2g17670 [Solanum tuberosum]